jgi:hypothetical protein
MVRSGSPICILAFSDKLERPLRWKAGCIRMRRGGSACENSVTDQALTHVKIYRAEHLADLIGASADSKWMIYQLVTSR